MSSIASSTPRRGFLGGIAAGAAALVAGRFSSAHAEVLASLEPPTVGDEFLTKIKGTYKQVFDCVEPNDGWGPVFALTYVGSTEEAKKVTDKDVTAVVVMRHFSMPLTLNDATWAKYKIGAMLKINDPKTNAPATRNIFYNAIPLNEGLTYEQAIATKPIVMVACNKALTVISSMAAKGAGVTADQAKKDWEAGLFKGVYLAPSGVYAVNRAQQAGCTYCYGG
jgi:hypothetical protein